VSLLLLGGGGGGGGIIINVHPFSNVDIHVLHSSYDKDLPFRPNGSHFRVGRFAVGSCVSTLLLLLFADAANNIHDDDDDFAIDRRVRKRLCRSPHCHRDDDEIV
jgi:hypothetical protein